MKWLTLDWWMDGGPREAAEAYLAYLDGVRDTLPAGAAPLLGEVCLHDARLRSLRIDVAAGRLGIELDGFKYTRKGVEDCRRLISLHYSGVREVRSTADPERELQGPHGYGDLGYDEFEVLPDGTAEHRMLFSTGIELAVVFEQVGVSYRDVARGDTGEAAENSP